MSGKLKGWREMESAPKDGTEIIVIETPNGEHFNVMVACFMARMNDDEQHMWRDKDNSPRAMWWGVYPTHWSSNGPHHTHWKPIACSTPLCWKPLPKMDLSRNTLDEIMESRP
jgi:hypothetical protein